MKSHYFHEIEKFHTYSYKEPIPVQIYLDSNHIPWTTEEINRLNDLVEMKTGWREIKNIMNQYNKREAIEYYMKHTNRSNETKEWTIEEEKQLLIGVSEYDEHNWCNISDMFEDRTPLECFKHYQQSLNKQIYNDSSWTLEDDTKLRNIYSTKLYSSKMFQLNSFPGRSFVQCTSRWKKIKQSNKVLHGYWTLEEERRLIIASKLLNIPKLSENKKSNEEIIRFFSDHSNGMGQVGVNRSSSEVQFEEYDDGVGDIRNVKIKNNCWEAVSQLVRTKSSLQCREKWCNALDPTINLNEFTAEENKKLSDLIQIFGSGKWSLIATYMPGRTDGQLRSQWMRMWPDERLERGLKQKLLPAKFNRNMKSKLTTDDFEPVLRLKIEPLNHQNQNFSIENIEDDL